MAKIGFTLRPAVGIWDLGFRFTVRNFGSLLVTKKLCLLYSSLSLKVKFILMPYNQNLMYNLVHKLLRHLCLLSV